MTNVRRRRHADKLPYDRPYMYRRRLYCNGTMRNCYRKSNPLRPDSLKYDHTKPDILSAYNDAVAVDLLRTDTMVGMLLDIRLVPLLMDAARNRIVVAVRRI